MQENELRACFVRNGMLLRDVSEAVGWSSPNTITYKMKRGSFTIPEAKKLIEALHLTDPVEICHIFFDMN